MSSRTRERKPLIHRLFEAGISLKFLDGALEIVGAILLSFISPETINHAVFTLLTGELLEDPHDVVANLGIHVFHGLSLGQQSFAVAYLLFHGLVKVGLVVALWHGKPWAYPLAGIVLGLLTIYQVYLFVGTASVFQLVLTVLDVAILVLLWLEWRRVRPTMVDARG